MVRKGADRVKTLLKAGKVFFGVHSRFRMEDRMITESDLESVGATAHTLKPLEDGKWRVIGKDEDGCDIKIICRMSEKGDGLFIISVIDEF